MVVEYIRYLVPTARAAEFDEAYRRASRVLDADPHCGRYEVARGVEEPEHFVVRIEWDSVEGHERGRPGVEGLTAARKRPLLTRKSAR